MRPLRPKGHLIAPPKTGEEYYRGYARGGIYMLLSPCIRETSNEVAERVSLHGYTIIVTRLLMFNV